nr:SPOR domain-containing protein [Lachnospiraceae bacterium]
IDMYFEGYEFERIDKEDIPVYTAEDVLMPYLDPDAGPEDLFVADADTRPFYGVFVSSTKDRDAAIKTAEKLIDDGYDGTVTHTTEWAGLNKDPYCVVLAGRFDTKEDAEAVLKDVKKDGYKDAFVKYSAECNGLRVNVTAFTTNSVNVRKDCVILRFGNPVFTYDWSPYFEEFGYETWGDIFYVDENTEFDKSCDMEGFARYKKGDTVLDWYQRNNSLMNEDPESNATDAFVGVFDVSVSGNHVNRYYGIYWWD